MSGIFRFVLTNERVKLCAADGHNAPSRRRTDLRLEAVDFCAYIRDDLRDNNLEYAFSASEAFIEKMNAFLTGKGTVKLCGNYLNYRTDSAYLAEILYELALKRYKPEKKYGEENTGNVYIYADGKHDFFAEYGAVRIKSLKSEFKEACLYTFSDKRIKKGLSELRYLLENDCDIRTAALIMAAHCGYLDTVRKNGTYEKIKSINNDSLDMYGRFSFEALIFNAGEALVNNAVSNVGRLFFKADSRRQSIDSINWIFYSAVYNFLTGCRCT